MTVKFTSGKVKILAFSWLSDINGDITIPVLNHAGYSLAAVETVPGLDGDLTTTLPTSYDVLINDEYGHNLAAGETTNNLAGRSASVAEIIYSNPMVPILGELSIVISSAGNAKTGLILLFLERKSH